MPTRAYSGTVMGQPPVIEANMDGVSCTLFPNAFFGVAAGDDGANLTTALATYNVVWLCALPYTFNTNPTVASNQVVYVHPGTTFSGTSIFTGGTLMPTVGGPSLAIEPSGALGSNLPRFAVTVATAGLTTSGTVYLTAISLPVGLTISNIAAMTGTGTLKTGGTHGWYCLCDSARKVRAATADQTDAATVWGSASTAYALAIASANGATATTFTTTYSGLYYIGFMVANNAGSQPNMQASATVTTGPATAPPILCGASATISQTTAPATDGSVTIGAITPDGSKNFWFWVT